MGLMEGKKGLVVGVANERSIAWGIAKALAREGACLAFTYAMDQLEKRVRPLAKSVDSSFVHKLDVSNNEQIDSVFESLKEHFGQIDFLVHGVAFSDKEQLKGLYLDTTRENFLNTMDISVYSFAVLSRKAVELMPEEGGSILTLSFYGAQKVITNYNVMGVAKAALEASVQYMAVDLGPRNIRVNAISAGAVKTLASAGISNFKEMLNRGASRAPLGRNVTLDEIGNAGVYLLSELSTATTGEILFVDSGYHVTGV